MNKNFSSPQDNLKDDLVLVAVIGKTVGLGGFLRLNNKSDFTQQFKKDAIFFNENKDELKICDFEKSKFLVRFYGFESIDSAKNLVNTKLFSTKELSRKNCKLKKGEFFYFDIIGCQIMENEEILGRVEDILEIASSKMLLISTDESLKDLPKEFYLPYLDNFILDVDLGKKLIFAKNAKNILINS